VPDSVCRVYGVEHLHFGPDYIIPKPFDPRVLVWEASAVAEAAMKSGVAQLTVELHEYREQLERRLGKAHAVRHMMIHKAQTRPKRVVFPEAEDDRILRACQILVDEKIAYPILLGPAEAIRQRAKELGASLHGTEIINPADSALRPRYVEELYQLRQRRGVALAEARTLMSNPNLFGSMMVHLGDADALVSGVTQHYPDTIRPALQVIKVREDLHRVSACYVVITRPGDIYFLADCAVNIESTAEELAEITLCTAQLARRFDVTPQVAMLSFSNFGSVKHPLAEKVRRATELVKRADPTLMVDGEMQADTAVTPEIVEKTYPFSALRGPANVLIFPDLTSANIAYKLLMRLGGAEAIGPILMGLSKPVHVLQRGAEVEEIVNMAALAVVDAQDIAAHEAQRLEAMVEAEHLSHVS
jgi:malate dehydrogenase (oxaloacetate-decarboxylating)(NADP+)